MTSLIDLENSNLPIDYFTSVLPRAQYGDESVVSVGLNNTAAVLRVYDPGDKTKGALFDAGTNELNDNLQKRNVTPASSSGAYASPIRSSATASNLIGLGVI